MFKNRALALILAIFCVVMFTANDAEAKAKKNVRSRAPAARTKVVQAAGVNDARYAAIIMNPVTGEVYHEKNADARRYPASLTKMMTLYLLFEALEKHKTTLDARMDVSEYAASMPQTNLSLSPGDSIEVETAIKALVVRSANDVSVVVAEALGGDVNTFATMMTAKARKLGMKGTLFKNPNGLPNTGQYTTARDMAKLGIALKRDFPKYYRYFSTLQFSHNGVTYYTHNRVMLRYAGVDGIKTGFIGASGFNLVTSVVRGGRPLVGTVMGGASGAWRDNRMIQLLDESYQVVASRGAVRGKNYPANLPLPINPPAPGKGAGLDAATIPGDDANLIAATTQPIPEASEPEDGGEALPPATLPAAGEPVRPAVPFDAADQASVVPKQPAPAVTITVPPVTGNPPTRAPITVTATPQPNPEAAPASKSKVIELAPTAPAPAPKIPANSPFAVATPPAAPARPNPAPAAPVAAAPAPTVPADYAWGIQVGAFSSQALAVQASRTAMQVAAKALVTAKMAGADPAAGTVPVHRARLENLTQKDARKACEILISNNSPCFIYKAVK